MAGRLAIARPPVPSWVPAAASAVAAAAGCATVLVADPNEPGFYPVCPWLLLTGRWCPVCGALRAARALLTGDIGAAAGFNLLLLLALPAVLWAWSAWAVPRFGGPSMPAVRVAHAAWWSCLAVVLAFGVLRNLPVAPFTALAP